jgi:hypothetical protein
VEGFAGANIDQLISIAAKVVANREKMAKREKEKYLEKRQRAWPWASRRETKGLKAGEGSPTGKDRKTLSGKISVHTTRKRDIGEMNALIRKKKNEKKKVTVAATKSKEAYNLETNEAWENKSD